MGRNDDVLKTWTYQNVYKMMRDCVGVYVVTPAMRAKGDTYDSQPPDSILTRLSNLDFPTQSSLDSPSEPLGSPLTIGCRRLLPVGLSGTRWKTLSARW